MATLAFRVCPLIITPHLITLQLLSSIIIIIIIIIIVILKKMVRDQYKIEPFCPLLRG